MIKTYHCYYDKCAQKAEELPGILYLKEKGQFCFYDSTNNTFLGSDLKPIDISGCMIIPHDYITVAEEFHSEIKASGGILPVDIDKENMVRDWLTYYKPKRKMKKIKARDLIEPKTLDEIEKEYGTEIFFKTIKKSYYSIVKTDYLRNPKTIINRALTLHQDEEFLISEVVDITRDELGSKEYRIFVYNNQILNISRYTDCFLHRIEPEVYETAKSIIEELSSLSFPSSYVMDLFEYKDKNGNITLDLLEFNKINASGRYLYNSVDHYPTDDMLHEDPTNIAIEKRPLVSLCLIPEPKYQSFIDSFGSSTYCGQKGTFAYDLKRLNDYNNIIGYDNKFNLGRELDDYPIESSEEEQTNENSNSGFSEIISIIHNTKEVIAKQEKIRFLESLGYDECPVDEMYLTRFGLPEPEYKEIPKEIKIKPEILKRLKEEHKL